MIYLGITLVVALVAVLIFLVSLRLLIGNWMLAWLRGSAGLSLAACALVLGLSAWDLHGYKQVSETQPIATLTFNKVDDKQFNVNLIDQAGNEQRYQLSGDLWQFDVRVLKWFDALARFGVKPGYRFERLSGRYLALADEQKLPHTAIDLSVRKPIIDVWLLLRSVNRYFSIIEAQEASASYQPMVDGALFSVSIGPTGMIAQPLNERAKLAVEKWE